MRLSVMGALAVVLVAGAASPVPAEVSVSPLIGDHMVLQQGRPFRIWGQAAPGEAITVTLAGGTASATAGAEGRWAVELGPLAAGGPHTLEIVGSNRLRFEDVLVGEVWIASGQSNMEFPLTRAANGEEEIAAARFPRIRLFTVPKATAEEPQRAAGGEWRPCSPETVGDFSAVAYFFGRELRQTLGVPVGLIHTSWGGTPAEAWTSRGALLASPELKPLVEDLDRLRSDPAVMDAYQRAMAEWEKTNVALDPGNEGETAGFASPGFDDNAWETMELPQYWEAAGLDIDGAVWFRRAVEIPEAWRGKDLELSLGALDDSDTTYFDGVVVGTTGTETPSYWTHPRRYRVPGRLVTSRHAVIAVRVWDRGGDGGFAGSPKDLTLRPADGAGEPLGLAGEWRRHVERAVGPINPDWGSQPLNPSGQNAPTMLYNAMIAPLLPYTIRGAIWYQGESNADRARQYRTLFPAMIRDWRSGWGQGDFPFYFVQLANYMKRADQPGESDWAELREAQRLTLCTPATGMAVAIDIGEADDIHPTDKQDVGHRLALNALARTYHRHVEFSGPDYRHFEIVGGQIRLAFDHAEGLDAKGGALHGFAIAGADRRFVWADARIDGKAVVVSSPEVAAPVAVRYGWADNPDCTLVNGAGLPASPFRTDDWPTD